MLKYIDLATAKSEALDNIYILFKQNINPVMLSGEGNAWQRWKTTIGLISKESNFARPCSSLFLYISLPLFCTTTTWNFQKLLSYTYYGGNVVRVLVQFFFTALIFTSHWWPLAFLILSPPLQNFHVVLPTKKCLLFCISRSSSVVLLPRWILLACTYIFQICGHDN